MFRYEIQEIDDTHRAAGPRVYLDQDGDVVIDNGDCPIIFSQERWHKFVEMINALIEEHE